MKEQTKKIAVLGSTGSVGEQALDVARKCGMKVVALSANCNEARVEAQAREFSVQAVAMADERAANGLRIRLSDTDIRVYSGSDGICEMIRSLSCDVVLNSIIGEAGLLPTLAVIESGTRLALANKESLVVAGELVMARARERGVEILPVDSEHSAIYQSLKGGRPQEVKKILLTASGGPFFGRTRDELQGITAAQALAHPTWSMGQKITIDSATLMNKGFEVIEAVHLFGVAPSQVQVVVHRESIIHSMVEYIDNSIIAQLSVPDMRLCAQYAITYPERTPAAIKELDFYALSGLSFAKPDMETFSLLACAFESIEKGGAVPAVLNAANEIAVDAFLHDKISFLDIMDSVGRVVDEMRFVASSHTLDEILEADHEARARTRSLLAL